MTQFSDFHTGWSIVKMNQKIIGGETIIARLKQ